LFFCCKAYSVTCADEMILSLCPMYFGSQLPFLGLIE
jgi:hypothetical protein